jgi:hypothetical protein
MEINQLKSIQPNMRGHKLGSGINWYRAFKQEGVKQTGKKQGRGVY